MERGWKCGPLDQEFLIIVIFIDMFLIPALVFIDSSGCIDELHLAGEKRMRSM